VNKLFLLLFVSSRFMVFGQDALHTGTLTLGVGGLPYSYNSNSQKGGPTFTGNYEYRLWKYLAVEGGVDTLLPSVQYLQQFSVITPGQNLVSFVQTGYLPASDRSRVTLLTYGFKGILPLAKNRLELFAGFGGAYAWNSEYSGSLNAALGQASLGGRLALDRGHHFWLGTTLRGYTNLDHQTWAPLTINLGIRFGR
jgi:hypothetical protein